MTDSVAARVLRIVAGGANAVLDAVENVHPDGIRQQVLRELEGVATDARAELGRVLARRHLATKQLAEENALHEALSANLEIALSENREDLAQAAISKQLDIEAQLPLISQCIDDAAAAEKELEGYLNALSAKRRQVLEDISALKAGEFSPEASAEKPTPSTRNPAAATAARLEELEELARRRRVEERLATLKAKAEPGKGGSTCSR